MKNSSPIFLLYYRRINTYSLNVLWGALESRGLHHQVDIRRVTSPHDIAQHIAAADSERPILVCWSFYSPSFRECIQELSGVKAAIRRANVTHIAGGVHATAEPETTLRAGFDMVAIGEGEQTIVDLAHAFITSENLAELRGVAVLRDGNYSTNGSGLRVELDSFPPFAPGHGRFNPIEITRGCVYACKFCQTPFMFKARFRHRSVDNIGDHVKQMVERGLRDVRFITPTSLSYGSDDTSVRLDKVEELLSSIREIVGNRGRIFFGSFPSEVRPEHVSAEALRVIKKYIDNDNIIIGGQSGSNRVLGESKRGHNADVIVSAVRLTLESGLLPNVDFIFGLPGETHQDVQSTLSLMEHLTEMGARIHGHTFMPLPGTPYRNAPPGTIDQRSQRRLARLTSRGKLYGEWQKQVEIARDLQEVRETQSGGSELP